MKVTLAYRWKKRHMEEKIYRTYSGFCLSDICFQAPKVIIEDGLDYKLYGLKGIEHEDTVYESGEIDIWDTSTVVEETA